MIAPDHTCRVRRLSAASARKIARKPDPVAEVIDLRRTWSFRRDAACVQMEPIARTNADDSALRRRQGRTAWETETAYLLIRHRPSWSTFRPVCSQRLLHQVAPDVPGFLRILTVLDYPIGVPAASVWLPRLSPTAYVINSQTTQWRDWPIALLQCIFGVNQPGVPICLNAWHTFFLTVNQTSSTSLASHLDPVGIRPAMAWVWSTTPLMSDGKYPRCAGPPGPESRLRDLRHNPKCPVAQV
jgi:hypothetical protein